MRGGFEYGGIFFSLVLKPSRVSRSPNPAIHLSLLGQFPNEFTQIGCPPASGEIPSSCCGVARDSVIAVVTHRNIVEKRVLPTERDQQIEFKIQKAQRVSCYRLAWR